MAEHGGYRQPNNPAPVSGPGALSERTDGGAMDGMSAPQPMADYSGFDYRENKELNDQQAGAPLAGTPKQSALPMDLSAPTAFPDEPISFGADYGAGPGLNVAGIRGIQPETTSNIIFRAMQSDPTGQMEAIYNRLNLG